MERNSWLNNCKLYLIYSCFAAFTQLVYAQEQAINELELSAIADLANVTLTDDSWQAVLPILGDENRYFIATKAGKIFQLKDSEVSQPAFFDLKSALNNPNIIALTAFTLDPSFHYRDRDGYHTFYTAHTEVSKNITSKLSPKNTELSLPYDTVIMRWQLTYVSDQAPRLSRQHEVMRVAIHQLEEHIQQLSFNPYVEPWHDDFGLLFIALAHSQALNDDALYAGAILRIKPEKYGLASYTIPTNNPFAKNIDIADEVVFIAGQAAAHFDWIKKGPHNLLIQLTQQDSNILVVAKLGGDWRETIPQAQIKKQLPVEKSSADTLLYHGRELKSLRGKALRLKETDSAWQLEPIALSSSIDSELEVANIPHRLIKHNAKEQAKFSLHTNHDGELLLLEHSQQRLYAIKKPVLATLHTTTPNSQLDEPNSNSASVFILFVLLILTSCFWYLRKNLSNKPHFLHEQWGNFDVDVATQLLSLHQHHTQPAKKTLSLSSIIRSELLLNDQVISTISADATQAFSNELEKQVLSVFAQENQLKMVNEKQRKIQLCLTDQQKKRYLICLYYRVGNIRHTKLKYSQVISKAIDWHWLFAQYINPTATAKRKVKVKLQAQVTPKVLQTAPTAAPLSETQQQQASKSNQDFADANFVDNSATEKSNGEINQGNIDTMFVSALDKLVLMKKQGYLNESEFNIAKSKILKDLSSD